jgi:hypothetical protein
VIVLSDTIVADHASLQRAIRPEENAMSFQADTVQNQDRPARGATGEAVAAMDLASWEATLMARLDLAAPQHHARVIADAIRQAVRLRRAGVIEREAAIDVLVTAARIFALTTAEIEKACKQSRRAGWSGFRLR